MNNIDVGFNGNRLGKANKIIEKRYKYMNLISFDNY